MLTCKDASQLFSQSFDRGLTWMEKIGLWFHLLICKPCPKVHHQLTVLHEAGQRLSAEPEDILTSHPGLSQEAQGRILKELQRKQGKVSDSD